MSKTIYAKDQKCCKCGKPAVAFWPCIDPDIRRDPYCQECLERARIELMIAIEKGCA